MASSYSETLRVRYSDADAQGHMFFANYLVFADEIASHYMETLGFDWRHPEQLPMLVFTVNVNCDYLSECRIGDEVRVDVAYEHVGNTSARLGFTMTRAADAQLLARGQFTQVFVDRDTRRPAPVPDSVRAAIP